MDIHYQSEKNGKKKYEVLKFMTDSRMPLCPVLLPMIMILLKKAFVLIIYSFTAALLFLLSL